MSSWVSHLPPDVAYGRVIGLGMNADGLAANPRLDAWIVHDLNAQPRLPFRGRRVRRRHLLASPSTISWSRWPSSATWPACSARGRRWWCRSRAGAFPTKVIAGWEALDDASHVQLVGTTLREAGGWDEVIALDRSQARAIRSSPSWPAAPVSNIAAA